MLVNLNTILSRARREGYAVGAFNTSNLEISQAILQAAERLNAPVIIATSEKALRYAGIENISQMVRTMTKSIKIPVVLHLDHGRSYEITRECIKHGYTSVMIDGSHLGVIGDRGREILERCAGKISKGTRILAGKVTRCGKFHFITRHIDRI